MCELFGGAIPCFEGRPSWWTPLANLTGWFDWDAIGAISTALALYMTIRLATEARRERRQREAVLLGTAAHILRAAYLSVETAVRNLTATSTWLEADRRYLERRLLEDDIDQRLNTIAPFHLPTVHTAEAYQAARLSLENIKAEMIGAGDQCGPSVIASKERLLRNLEILEGQSYVRSRGVVISFLRVIWKTLRRQNK